MKKDFLVILSALSSLLAVASVGFFLFWTGASDDNTNMESKNLGNNNQNAAQVAIRTIDVIDLPLGAQEGSGAKVSIGRDVTGGIFSNAVNYLKGLSTYKRVGLFGGAVLVMGLVFALCFYVATNFFTESHHQELIPDVEDPVVVPTEDKEDEEVYGEDHQCCNWKVALFSCVAVVFVGTMVFGALKKRSKSGDSTMTKKKDDLNGTGHSAGTPKTVEVVVVGGTPDVGASPQTPPGEGNVDGSVETAASTASTASSSSTATTTATPSSTDSGSPDTPPSDAPEDREETTSLPEAKVENNVSATSEITTESSSPTHDVPVLEGTGLSVNNTSGIDVEVSREADLPPLGAGSGVERNQNVESTENVSSDQLPSADIQPKDNLGGVEGEEEHASTSTPSSSSSVSKGKHTKRPTRGNPLSNYIPRDKTSRQTVMKEAMAKIANLPLDRNPDSQPTTIFDKLKDLDSGQAKNNHRKKEIL